MTSFTITVDDKAVRDELKRLADSAKNPRPALLAIGEELVKQAKAGFGTSTDPWGKKWRPNKKATIKAKKGQTLPLIGESRQLSSRIAYKSTGNSVTISSPMVYAAIHQFGGTIERAPYSAKVRHRTDAKGNLLRTKLFGGKGLIFAKDKHKRAIDRWFEVKAYKINIPARPFLPVTKTGQLAPAAQKTAVDILREYLAGK